MCPDGLRFLSRQLKICPDSPKCVRTLQDVSGQFKICPDSSTCVRTVQNMVGRERWLRTFLVCRERDLRVFRPEDFWLPPGRYKVFRPLVCNMHVGMTVKSNRFEQHLEVVWIFIVQISLLLWHFICIFQISTCFYHYCNSLDKFPNIKISKYITTSAIIIIPFTNFDPYFTLKIVKKTFWNFEKLVLWIDVLLSILVFVKVWMNLNDMKRFASDLYIKEAKNCISKIVLCSIY